LCAMTMSADVKIAAAAASSIVWPATRVLAPDANLADGGDAARVVEAETSHREFDDRVVGAEAFGLDVDDDADAGRFIVRRRRQVKGRLVDPSQDPIVAARVEPAGHLRQAPVFVCRIVHVGILCATACSSSVSRLRLMRGRMAKLLHATCFFPSFRPLTCHFTLPPFSFTLLAES